MASGKDGNRRTAVSQIGPRPQRQWEVKRLKQTNGKVQCPQPPASETFPRNIRYTMKK